MPQIPINKIEIDPRLSPRMNMDATVVSRYVGAIEAGAEFPPVLVGQSGARHILLDGAHRLAAHKQAAKTTINCIVSQRHETEWFEEAVASNARNGLPLTDFERIEAAKRLHERGYDFEKISRIVAVPAARLERACVVLRSVSAETISKGAGLATAIVTRATTKHAVCPPQSADRPPRADVRPMPVPLAEAFALVIESLESESTPQQLFAMEERTYRALKEWLARYEGKKSGRAA